MNLFYGLELTNEEIDFARAYFESMIWADQPEGAALAISDLEPDFVRAQTFEAISFYLRYEYAIGYASVEQAGRDLWLTRNGHGAGFWDRGDTYKDVDSGYDFASLLTEAAERLGSLELDIKAATIG